VLSLLAIKVNNRIYPARFAVYALVCELGWKRLAPSGNPSLIFEASRTHVA
jgi:hypothetical protein